MFVSYTRLELKSYWKLFQFLSASNKAKKQAETSSGNQQVATYNEGFRYFLTLSAWDKKEDMLRFMRSGAHAEAMKRSKEFAKSVVTINFDLDYIPDWKEAKERLDNSLKER